jgi:acetyl esterase
VTEGVSRVDGVLDAAARRLAAAALRPARLLRRALWVPEILGLDPQLAAFLAIQRRSRLPSLETLPVAAARRLSHRGLAPLDSPPARMQAILEISGVGAPGLRVYRPHRRGAGLLLYFHGGGGVIGSIESHDAWCRFLAWHAEVQVVSVEYRLAPEHPHPAAIEDAVAAWRWVVDNAARLGATRLGVAGDSFGGYLAAMIDQATSRPRHHPRALPGGGGLPPPHVQALIYPLLDLAGESPSHDEFADGFLLTRPIIDWFLGHYLGAGRADAALLEIASPARLPVIARAAPAIVVTAGFDPLRDEDRAYARRLGDEAGAAVELQEHSDLVHGFVVMTGAIDRARVAGLQLAASVREQLR